METEKQLVIIKGTKEGLIFYIDELCSFQELVDDLSNTLATSNTIVEEKTVSVIIKLGYRYLQTNQKERLKILIEADNRFKIERFDSKVISRAEAESWHEHNEVKSIFRIVRSGQIVEVVGSLLLIGDVNPGATVKATGNIYIIGSLFGIAHAGMNGDEKAVIVASFMNPAQLRIANYISRAPDYESDGVYMECGFFDEKENKILIDRLQVLPHVRKGLQGLERGI